MSSSSDHSVASCSPAAWFDVLRRIIEIKQDRVPVRISVPSRARPAEETRGEAGFLTPLTERHLGDDGLIETFVRWRNQNLTGYLDQRPVTYAGTSRWLEKTVLDPLRMAFLVHWGDRLIGRCGFVNLTPHDQEADGLVRGERGGGMGFLFDAQVAGLNWIFRNIGSGSVVARVLNTNDLALENCRRMGYDLIPFASNPVYRRVTPEGSRLLDCGRDEERLPGVELHSIRLSREAFFRSNAEFVAGGNGEEGQG